MLLTMFALVSVRILAMIFAAPVLGSRNMPISIRICLGLAIGAVALPLVGVTPTVPGTPTQFVSALFSEALIGGLLGLGVLIIYSATEMAGNSVGQMAGIQIDTFTGSDISGQSPTGKLFAMMSAAVFVLINGPELLVGAVLDTFQTTPVGSPIDPNELFGFFSVLLTQSFVLAIRAVGPALVAILVTTIVIGMISRTIPQLNVLQVGLSANLAIMFLAVFLTLGGCVWMFVDDLETSVQLIQQTLVNATKQGK